MVISSGTALAVGKEGEMSGNVSLAERGEKKEREGGDDNMGVLVKKEGDEEVVAADEPLIKKHWPDNYKMLNKLVTWLIDDPDARVYHADVKRRLEEEGLRVTEGGVVRHIKRRPSEGEERGMSTSGLSSGGEKGSPLSSSSSSENKKIKTSTSDVSARGAGVWSTDDSRRLCNALLRKEGLVKKEKEDREEFHRVLKLLRLRLPWQWLLVLKLVLLLQSMPSRPS
eukprot:evm.model.NODE_8941_length_7211_cov_36.003605.4